MSVELHGAFCWDCDECGVENFERAIEGNVDEAAMMADENQVVGALVAPDATEDESRTDDEREAMLADVLVQTILIAPKRVKCKACGSSFETEIATCEE